MNNATTQFIQQTYRQPFRPAKLRRIAKEGQTEIHDRNDPYNDFIWALARKFTDSAKEAEAAVREMHADIQRCAERGMVVKSNEERLIARIAWRRLLKFLQ